MVLPCPDGHERSLIRIDSPMPTISAVSLPDHLDEHGLRDKVAVVIDVLRATTTIAHALASGAACVVPVSSVDGARLIAHDRPGSLLCGERGGVRPEGFTLGNSPLEYTPDLIQAREIVLTTTNGTRALQMCSGAAEIYTGSITNLSALCGLLGSQPRDIVLVCSGTDRRVSLEDCIAAGLIAQRLQATHAADDSAMLMRHAAEGAIERCGSLEAAIASSFHAKRLIDLGFAEDVQGAACIGACPCVPHFDPATGEIHPASLPNASHA